MSARVLSIGFQRPHPVPACGMGNGKHKERGSALLYYEIHWSWYEQSLGFSIHGFGIIYRLAVGSERNIPRCAECPALRKALWYDLGWIEILMSCENVKKYVLLKKVSEVSTNATPALTMPYEKRSIRRMFTEFVISGFPNQHFWQSSNKEATIWPKVTRNLYRNYSKQV